MKETLGRHTFPSGRRAGSLVLKEPQEGPVPLPSGTSKPPDGSQRPLVCPCRRIVAAQALPGDWHSRQRPGPSRTLKHTPGRRG